MIKLSSDFLAPGACGAGEGGKALTLLVCCLPALLPQRLTALPLPPQECDNPCCNASNCTLREGAECAHGSCCHRCKVSCPFLSAQGSDLDRWRLCWGWGWGGWCPGFTLYLGEAMRPKFQKHGARKTPLNEVYHFLYWASRSSCHPWRLCVPPGRWEIKQQVSREQYWFGAHHYNSD